MWQCTYVSYLVLYKDLPPALISLLRSFAPSLLPPSPVMSESVRSFLPRLDDAAALAAASSASSAAASASAQRKHLVSLYSNEYWWTLGGFIGVLAVLHLAQLLSHWILLRRHSRSNDSELGGSRARRRPPSVVSRLWRASASLVNIILYRLPIPLRRVHNLGNLAEILCVGAYMGATLAWALMHTPDVNVPTVSWPPSLSFGASLTNPPSFPSPQNWANRAGELFIVTGPLP